jgi:hypothetical protein
MGRAPRRRRRAGSAISSPLPEREHKCGTEGKWIRVLGEAGGRLFCYREEPDRPSDASDDQRWAAYMGQAMGRGGQRKRDGGRGLSEREAGCGPFFWPKLFFYIESFSDIFRSVFNYFCLVFSCSNWTNEMFVLRNIKVTVMLLKSIKFNESYSFFLPEDS